MEVMDSIYHELDESNLVLGLFLDLHKAFDMVDHEILLEKMYAYGIRGNMHKWFSSYLSHRTQFTVVNDSYSSKLVIKRGVPQGSVLGPLLFLLYINDISNVSQDFKIRLFADDSNIFICHKNVDKLFELANNVVTDLQEWFICNRMCINMNKTNYMVFNLNDALIKEISEHNLHIFINSKSISRVSCVKYLGIFMDDKLSWKNHISHLKNKIIKFVGIFYKKRDFLPKACRKNLYFAMVHSNILHGIEIYGNTYQSNLRGLETTVNKILRILQGKRLKEIHCMDLYKEYETLPVSDLFKFQIVKFMHTYHVNIMKLPKVFHNYFLMNSLVHSHNTRRKNDYHIVPAHSNIGARSIQQLGNKIWLQIPDCYKKISNPYKFLSNIKSLNWKLIRN